MSPQVFRGRTVRDAHRTALEQLGPEAVVLTTRSVARQGIGGLFGASEVELSATLPDRTQSAPPGASRSVPFAPGAYATAVTSGISVSGIAALRTELKGDIRSLRALVAKSGDSADLAAEIAQLRDLVESLVGAKPSRDKVAAQLRTLGIEGPVSSALVRALKGKTDAALALREELARLLQTTAWPLEGGQTMIAVIGSSGVGKTTTAAKLAARARMDGKTVTLVACDSYRVGAVEQVASYAELMGAELATARTCEELSAILDSARTDVVLVDTSGRPPAADGVEIALMPSRRSAPKASARTRHVLLCVPATLRSHDAARLVKRYGALAPTSLAVTKIDETDAPAGILHASWAAKLPVSVVCFGQRVPEDIAPATVSGLVDYVAPRHGGGSAA